MAKNTKSNKITGLIFERAICDALFNGGYWVLNVAPGKDGQPADSIAVKGGKSYLIDCKVCKDDRFMLGRIEPNQESAMQLWEERTTGIAGFAIVTGDSKIYFLPADKALELKKQVSTIKVADHAMTWEEFIKEHG